MSSLYIGVNIAARWTTGNANNSAVAIRKYIYFFTAFDSDSDTFETRKRNLPPQERKWYCNDGNDSTDVKAILSIVIQIYQYHSHWK